MKILYFMNKLINKYFFNFLFRDELEKETSSTKESISKLSGELEFKKEKYVKRELEYRKIIEDL
jgi:hypothetical protein